MNRVSIGAFAFLFGLGTAVALAADGVSVTNRDSQAHIIVFEDQDENLSEITVEPGARVENPCVEGCFLWLKEAEDFQFVDKGVSAAFFIRGGQLVTSDTQAGE